MVVQKVVVVIAVDICVDVCRNVAGAFIPADGTASR